MCKAEYATDEEIKKIQDEAVMPTVLVGQTSEEEEEPTAAPTKVDQPLLKAIELLKVQNK